MQVATVACDKYQIELVEDKMRQALDLLGGIDSFIKEGDKVLLKPNLLSPHNPDLGVTTHPVIVRALIKLIQEAGGIVQVGESSGGMLVNRSLTTQAFVETGIKKVCQELGVEIINFDRVETSIRLGPTTGEEFPLPKALLEADVVISVPKLKTHSLTLFTGAVKNLYGCIPGMKKAEYHRLYPNPQDFANLVVDIFAAVEPDLTIMDGIYGLEGNGPGTTGELCEIGTILIGSDLVAVDTLAASYLGYEEDQVPITSLASDRGLGSNQLDQIEVVGDFKKPTRKYKLPSNALLSALPSWLLTPVFNSLLATPEIEQEECIECGLCKESCPQQVIRKNQSGLKIEEKDCIKCLCCQELCPQDAVKLKEHPLAKGIKLIKKVLG